jgi:hypothetical protein
LHMCSNCHSPTETWRHEDGRDALAG